MMYLPQKRAIKDVARQAWQFVLRGVIHIVESFVNVIIGIIMGILLKDTATVMIENFLGRL